MSFLIKFIKGFFTFIASSFLSSKLIKAVAVIFTFEFLKKGIALLGFVVLTYVGSSFTLDAAYDQMQAQINSGLTGLPSQWYQVIFMGAFELRLDDALTNVFTAYAIAYSITTYKASSTIGINKKVAA